MFAKLYETEELGQILIKIDDGEEGPEVRVYFEPKGLGVCSMAYTFSDEKATAWVSAEKAFETLDEQSAIDTVKALLKQLELSQ